MVNWFNKFNKKTSKLNAQVNSNAHTHKLQIKHPPEGERRTKFISQYIPDFLFDVKTILLLLIS